MMKKKRKETHTEVFDVWFCSGVEWAGCSKVGLSLSGLRYGPEISAAIQRHLDRRQSMSRKCV